MKFNKIITKKAPLAMGAYSQGVDLGKIIITSGQLPINPQNGKIATDISEQVLQCLENVKAIIEAATLRVSDIVKTTVFVINLNDFEIINATYEEFFTMHSSFIFPARSCVEVSRLPKNVNIEIEAIAIRR